MRLLHSFKDDFPASIVVFLVALPLCLGIALASGAPLISGLISGIMGGIVVSLLSGSKLSVSGPAAGLTVIVVNGIQTVGSFRLFLAAVVIAGIIQVILGKLRVGSLANLFPTSVISGMLSAIGVIIILKQIPHALGTNSDYEGDMNFIQLPDHENTISTVYRALSTIHPGSLITVLVGIFLFLSWDKWIVKRIPLFKFIPGPLLVVFSGIGLNFLFQSSWPALYFGHLSEFMVNLPVATSASDVLAQITMPSVSFDKLPAVLSVGITIAIVASVETLLSVEAADKMDPLNRRSDPDKELVAQGAGNIFSGLLGGLPITAVIVRTSANVYAGAKTPLSAFIHGLFLLASVLFLAEYLNMIPLSSLAAVLIVVGFRLASPQHFIKFYKKGLGQLVPFLVTLGITVFTDLLTGVFSGVVTSLLIGMRENARNSLTHVREGNSHYITFTKDITFASKLRLKNMLLSIPSGSDVLIDCQRALYLDADIRDELENFNKNSQKNGIAVNIVNVRSWKDQSLEREIRRYGGAASEVATSQ